MSSIPPGLARVPNLLLSRAALSSISRSSVGLYGVQQQLATGQRISRPGEDPVAAATLSVLDARLERSVQIVKNLEHASSSLSSLDVALGEASDLVLEARQIALEQVNSTYTDADRDAQATVVDSLLKQLFTLGNRSGVQGYLFGGTSPGTAPVSEFFGGYRYNAGPGGLLTDLRQGSTAPLTIGNGGAIGSTSARVAGFLDLDPALSPSTRLTDLEGARGLGVSTGTISMRFDGGPTMDIDLSHAENVGDIVDALTSAIRRYETDNGVTILDTGGVSVSGGSVSIDVVAGPPDPELTFADVGSGVTARDLGLASDSTTVAFAATTSLGLETGPRLTWTTALADLQGLDIAGAGALGTIRISNAGRTRDLDLSSATTLQDVKNLLESAGLGIRVQINEAGNGIDVLNEVAGSSSMAMSITDASGLNPTASRLGIRTFAPETLASDLNDGRGIRIVHNQTDPTTGLPDPDRDVDFRIVLGDAGGTTLDVDLRPQDLTTMQAVLARINAQLDDAAVAAGYPAGTVTASIGATTNGIILTRTGAFPGALAAESANNSHAAADLGLINGAVTSGGATLTGSDPASVRPDNLFTALMDLREALASNSTSGIAIAGERLGRFVDLVAQERGTVGAYAKRIDQELVHEEGRRTVDLTTRSQLIDTDFAEAATRLSLLQTQLTAGMQATAMATSRSLMDFLG